MPEAVWLLAATVPAFVWGGEPALAVLVVELAALAGLVLWLALGLKGARPAPLALACAASVGIALAANSARVAVHPPNAVLELGWWLALVLVWRLVQGRLDGFDGLARLVAALALAGALVSALGLYQTLLGADEILGDQKIAYARQVSGTFVNPSHMASYLVLALPGALALALVSRTGLARVAAGGAAALMVLALVFSRSRGGWIAGVVGLVALAGASRSPHAARGLAGALALVAAVVGLGLVASPDAVPALTARLSTLAPGGPAASEAFGRLGPWGVAARLVRARPLAGWGPGAYALAFLSRRPAGYYYRPSHAHNEVLELGVELGLGGLVLALVIILGHARLGLAALTNAPGEPERLVTAGALAGALAFLCTTAWDWPLRVPADALAAAVLAGALAAVGRPAKDPLPTSGAPLTVVAAGALAVAAVLTGLWPRVLGEVRAFEARRAVRAGDAAVARARYREAREVCPALWRVALEEAAYLQASTDPEARAQGAAAAQAAVTAFGFWPDAWRALGAARIAAGDPLGAAAAYGAATALDPANHLPHLERANSLWEAGLDDLALAEYRSALDAYPVERIGEFPEVVRMMAPVAAALASPTPRALREPTVGTALRLLELRKARAPQDFRSYRLLAELYEKLGLGEEAAAERAAEARAVPPR